MKSEWIFKKYLPYTYCGIAFREISIKLAKAKRKIVDIHDNSFNIVIRLVKKDGILALKQYKWMINGFYQIFRNVVSRRGL